jgi:PEP-CTERM motif
MKNPTLLALSVLVISAIATFGQGTISVGNGITATRFPIYAVTSWNDITVGDGPLSSPTGTTVYNGSLLQGTRYRIEFWAGPASAIDFSGLTLITTMTFRTATGNVLPAGLTTTVQAAVPGVPADSQAKLGVRVWDTSSGLGDSYAVASIRGQSALFLSGPLGGISPGGGFPITPPNWIGQSFSIGPLSPPFNPPEPSSMAITGLGAAGLVAARRRKTP